MDPSLLGRSDKMYKMETWLRAKNNSGSGFLFYLYPIFFALAYSQDTLFTSNQNTKFISGLAHAGYRDIASDWMAGITDPFPLFSWLLVLQYKAFGLFVGIHLSFFVIVAVYAAMAIWLARNLLANEEGWQRTLLIFSLIWLFVHSSEIKEYWLILLPDGLADQYILRSAYQPVSFGVLLFIGVAAYIRGHPVMAAVFIILAPLFHPTYIISSALIATAMVFLPANRALEIAWEKRALFLSLVLVAIVPYAIWSIQTLSSGDPEIQSRAHSLLAEIRIPHHAIPSKWIVGDTLKFFVMSIVAAWLGRKWLPGQLVFVILLFIVATVAWAIIAPNPTLEVIAPWRVSSFIAPLSWIIILVSVTRWLTQIINHISFSVSRRVVRAGLIIVFSAASLIGIYRFHAVYKYKKTHDFYNVSRYLEAYHQAGNQYMVPVSEMYIRLEAGVPVFATWKSHPTRDNELLQWYERINVARTIYDDRVDSSEISALTDSYPVTHIICPADKGKYPFAGVGQKVYQDKSYSVWDIR